MALEVATAPSEVATVDLSLASAMVMESRSLRLSALMEVLTAMEPQGRTVGAQALPSVPPLVQLSMMRNLLPLSVATELELWRRSTLPALATLAATLPPDLPIQQQQFLQETAMVLP